MADAASCDSSSPNVAYMARIAATGSVTRSSYAMSWIDRVGVASRKSTGRFANSPMSIGQCSAMYSRWSTSLNVPLSESTRLSTDATHFTGSRWVITTRASGYVRVERVERRARAAAS